MKKLLIISLILTTSSYAGTCERKVKHVSIDKGEPSISIDVKSVEQETTYECFQWAIGSSDYVNKGNYGSKLIETQWKFDASDESFSYKGTITNK